MELVLNRLIFTNKTTIGELFLNKKFECYTLEDVIRNEKINGETAIPKGSYKVIIDRSIRFGRDMPHIIDVPNFTGIRIHAGNTHKDTKGCILVGKFKGNNYIANSVLAFESLFQKMKDAISNKEEITININ